MTAPILPSRWVITPADNTDDPNVLPRLPAQSFKLLKTPLWSSNISTSVSGVERRRALWSYPIWRFQVMHEYLRDDAGSLELQRLVTFFNSKFGSVTAFFYLDRDDFSATGATFGTGDGTTRAFQITRTTTIGGISFSEPVRGFNGTPTIYINGTATTAYTIGALGIITFTTAPIAGAALSWDGSFFYLCRFDKDELNLNQIFKGTWGNSSLEFRSVKA